MTEQQKDKALPRILQTDELPNKDYYPSMWAEVPKPIDDELLSSWMVRVAMSNLTTLPSIIYETLKIHPFNLDVDVTWNVELMDLFEKKTGETREILQKMGFHEIKKDIDKTIDEQNSLQMFSQIWLTSWRDRSKNGIRYCPKCLETDEVPYFRKNWRLGYVTICPIHDCFLEHVCPKCKSAIVPIRLDWDSDLRRCYTCGADLTDTAIMSTPMNDPLLSTTKDFFLQCNSENTHKVLSSAWFISKYTDLGNPIFNNHPFARDPRIVELWKKRYKLNLFDDIQASYLIIGTAISLLQDRAAADRFLKSFFSSIEAYWTKTPFKCLVDACEYTSSDFTNMTVHVRSHTGEKPFECPMCHERFGTNYRMEVHAKLHDQEHPFVCNVGDCPERFRNNIHYIHHLRTVHGIKPHVCETCGQAFDQHDELKRHVRTHTGEKPYICDICNKAFAQQTTMVSHRRTHTNEKPHVCEICGKGFIQSNSLTEHLRIHTNERPYKCAQCDKIFKRKHHLDLHTRTHTSEKPFVCDVCGKFFSDKGNLTKHSVQHNDERPYKCNECGKTFRYRTNLTSHVKSQHSNQKYVCEKCGRQFSRKDYLKSHINTKHAVEKHFSCSACGKQYASKRALQFHMDHHSDREQYTCEVCGKKYRLIGSYNVHKRVKHTNR